LFYFIYFIYSGFRVLTVSYIVIITKFN